jgi:hypothetical protein
MSVEHVTPERIAAYLARTLGDTARREVEDHLGYCEMCRRELANAARFANKWTARRVYARWIPAIVAAAAVVLLVVPSLKHLVTPEPAIALRGEALSGIPTFPAVAPADGATVAPDGIQFVWRAEIGDPFYTLYLLDELGDEVWSYPLTDTTVKLPDTVKLERGQVYYWYVDALLTGVQTSTTGIREMTITP